MLIFWILAAGLGLAYLAIRQWAAPLLARHPKWHSGMLAGAGRLIVARVLISSWRDGDAGAAPGEPRLEWPDQVLTPPTGDYQDRPGTFGLPEPCTVYLSCLVRNRNSGHCLLAQGGKQAWIPGGNQHLNFKLEQSTDDLGLSLTVIGFPTWGNEAGWQPAYQGALSMIISESNRITPGSSCGTMILNRYRHDLSAFRSGAKGFSLRGQQRDLEVRLLLAFAPPGHLATPHTWSDLLARLPVVDRDQSASFRFDTAYQRSRALGPGERLLEIAGTPIVLLVFGCILITAALPWRWRPTGLMGLFALTMIGAISGEGAVVKRDLARANDGSLPLDQRIAAAGWASTSIFHPQFASRRLDLLAKDPACPPMLANAIRDMSIPFR